MVQEQLVVAADSRFAARRLHARRLRWAHAVARVGVHLPMPLLWFTNNVLSQWIAPKLRDRQRCATIYDFDLVVRATTGAQYYRNGFYEQGTMHVISLCVRPGDVFVDAGASVGQMAFHAARLVGATGRVIAFEPAPERYEDLVDGIAINGFANVVPVAAGLANEPGALRLYLRGSPSMADQARREDTVEVPVHRLDDMLDEQRVASVRFLKIDVEGLEPEVLLGAARLLRSRQPPILCYEHGIYRHSVAIDDILPACYQLYQLAGTAHRPSKLVPVGRRLRADNVFAIPETALSSLPRELF